MTTTDFDRRLFLTGLGATLLGLATPALATSKPLIHVRKDPDCGCCGGWVEIMRTSGFAVDVEEVSWDELAGFKQTRGISDDMASCHTGVVGRYVIEGHVPAADIHRLLRDRPEALGLAVPGMPFGSPGMGPESEREAYSVYLIKADGSAEVFNHYPAA